MSADPSDLDRASLKALLVELEPLRARVQELERRLAERERRVAELETAAESRRLDARHDVE
jgi:hypothetical protein